MDTRESRGQPKEGSSSDKSSSHHDALPAIKFHLQWAVCDGNLEKVRDYIQQGADINAIHSSLRVTLLYLACLCKHEAIALELINLGARVDTSSPGDRGRTALMVACEVGFDSVVQRVLEQNVDVNLCDQEENSAFHAAYASWVQGSGRLDQLVEKTQLGVNSHRGAEKCLKLLLSAGCDFYSSSVESNSKERFKNITIFGTIRSMVRQVIPEPVANQLDELSAQYQSQYFGDKSEYLRKVAKIVYTHQVDGQPMTMLKQVQALRYAAELSFSRHKRFLRFFNDNQGVDCKARRALHALADKIKLEQDPQADPVLQYDGKDISIRDQFPQRSGPGR